MNKILVVLLSAISISCVASTRSDAGRMHARVEQTKPAQRQQQLLDYSFLASTTVASATHAAVITSKTTIIAKKATNVVA